jgi:hypothetical protein
MLVGTNAVKVEPMDKVAVFDHAGSKSTLSMIKFGLLRRTMQRHIRASANEGRGGAARVESMTRAGNALI